MQHDIFVDIRSQLSSPAPEEFIRWVTTVLNYYDDYFEIAVSLVDEPEMATFNQRYRQKSSPTNVLAFGQDLPAEFDDPEQTIPLGDVIICVPVVIREAQEQHKALDDHFAHLTIHGTLHLLGFDHETTDEAKDMETHEIELLQDLGIENPYERR